MVNLETLIASYKLQVYNKTLILLTFSLKTGYSPYPPPSPPSSRPNDVAPHYV